MSKNDAEINRLSLKYDEISGLLSNARDSMNRAWSDRKSKEDFQQYYWEQLGKTREDMNYEHERMQNEYSESQQIWDDYKRFRDHNNQDIENLKGVADNVAYKMRDAFESASHAFQYGDRADAPSFSAEGHRYKSELEDINDQIRSLGQQVKDARYRAEQSTGIVDNSRFKRAQAEFKSVKEKHQRSREEYFQAKAYHEREKQKFDGFKAELEQIKKQQTSRVNELNAFRKIRRQVAQSILLAHRHDWSQIIEKASRGKRRVQSEENGMTVKVLAGYSRKYDKPTTDILVIDHEDNEFHYHAVYDENGVEIYSGLRKNH